MPGQNSIPSRMQLDTVGGIAKAVYDFADVGGKQGNITLELELPAGTIIHKAYLDVQTAVTSGGSATIGLNFLRSGTSTQDKLILTADTLANTGVSTTGVKRLPLINGTGAVSSSVAGLDTPVKLDHKSVLNVIVGVADLTAGKFVVYLQYFGV